MKHTKRVLLFASLCCVASSVFASEKKGGAGRKEHQRKGSKGGNSADRGLATLVVPPAPTEHVTSADSRLVTMPTSPTRTTTMSDVQFVFGFPPADSTPGSADEAAVPVAAGVKVPMVTAELHEAVTGRRQGARTGSISDDEEGDTTPRSLTPPQPTPEELRRIANRLMQELSGCTLANPTGPSVVGTNLQKARRAAITLQEELENTLQALETATTRAMEQEEHLKVFDAQKTGTRYDRYAILSAIARQRRAAHAAVMRITGLRDQQGFNGEGFEAFDYENARRAAKDTIATLTAQLQRTEKWPTLEKDGNTTMYKNARALLGELRTAFSSAPTEPEAGASEREKRRFIILSALHHVLLLAEGTVKKGGPKLDENPSAAASQDRYSFEAMSDVVMSNRLGHYQVGLQDAVADSDRSYEALRRKVVDLAHILKQLGENDKARALQSTLAATELAPFDTKLLEVNEDVDGFVTTATPGDGDAGVAAAATPDTEKERTKGGWWPFN